MSKIAIFITDDDDDADHHSEGIISKTSTIGKK